MSTSALTRLLSMIALTAALAGCDQHSASNRDGNWTLFFKTPSRIAQVVAFRYPVRWPSS